MDGDMLKKGDIHPSKPVPNLESNIVSGWWFQIFFIFTPIWGRFPF